MGIERNKGKVEMRYFIAFYDGKLSNHRFSGNVAFESERYPSRKSLCKEINEMRGFNESTITNIAEVNKIDYDNWNA